VREYLLFKWSKDLCSEVMTVHFGTGRMVIDNMESQWIPYRCKHEYFCVNLMLRLCTDVVSCDGPRLA
jgi:hypothetical protein